MGQALYRKYRSKELAEIVGQEHITTALKQALKTGRISHAYLFTGPRGTGKTSIARILAHEINGLPYSTEPQLDIIEIDAASNRRIDEIRDLRDKVYIAPTSAKYKVYIIDEVHMLTREAFNALLKTLEEPPEHVVFILATTDAHKLPETIISRTQRYNFKPVAAHTVADHLAFIAKKEGIKADPEALLLLAEHGQGSFRDSISMLDQVSNHGDRITVDAVRAQLGIPPEAAVQAVLATLTSGDISAPVVALQGLYDDGYRAAGIAEQLGAVLRAQLTDGVGTLSAIQALTLLHRLLDVPGAANPERYLEIMLMEAAAPASVPAAMPVMPPAPPRVVTVPTTVPEPAPKKTTEKAKAAKAPEPASLPPAEREKPASKPHKAKPAANGSTQITPEAWAAVLAELKKQYNTLYGIVRMAQTDFEQPGSVQLTFAFPFHQKRINDPKNRKIVADTIFEVIGQHVELVCIVSRDATPTPLATITAPANTEVALQDISNVFGGGELL